MMQGKSHPRLPAGTGSCSVAEEPLTNDFRVLVNDFACRFELQLSISQVAGPMPPLNLLLLPPDTEDRPE